MEPICGEWGQKNWPKPLALISILMANRALWISQYQRSHCIVSSLLLLFNAEQRLPSGRSKRPLPVQTGTLRGSNGKVRSSIAFDLAEEKFADSESFIKALSHEPVLQARFAQFLMQEPVSKSSKELNLWPGRE